MPPGCLDRPTWTRLSDSRNTILRAQSRNRDRSQVLKLKGLYKVWSVTGTLTQSRGAQRLQLHFWVTRTTKHQFVCWDASSFNRFVNNLRAGKGASSWCQSPHDPGTFKIPEWLEASSEFLAKSTDYWGLSNRSNLDSKTFDVINVVSTTPTNASSVEREL